MTTNLTEKQSAAVQKLKDANGRGVVLHIGVGTKLVDKGLAVKLDTSGHGRMMAEYRAV